MTSWLVIMSRPNWLVGQTNGLLCFGVAGRQTRTFERMAAGDVAIAYVSKLGIVGEYEVMSGSRRYGGSIWDDPKFVHIVDLKPVRVLEPEQAVPLKLIASELEFVKDPRYYMHSLRQSLKQISSKDLRQMRKAISLRARSRAK